MTAASSAGRPESARFSAFYRHARTIFALSGTSQKRLDDFASHVTLMTRSPSLFDPGACIEGDRTPVRTQVESVDWTDGRWHTFDLQGSYAGTMSEDEMRTGYRRFVNDPFMFASVAGGTVEVVAEPEGTDYDMAFTVNGERIEDPAAALRGLVRLDDAGTMCVPAGLALFIQAASVFARRRRLDRPS